MKLRSLNEGLGCFARGFSSDQRRRDISRVEPRVAVIAPVRTNAGQAQEALEAPRARSAQFGAIAVGAASGSVCVSHRRD